MITICKRVFVDPFSLSSYPTISELNLFVSAHFALKCDLSVGSHHTRTKRHQRKPLSFSLHTPKLKLQNSFPWKLFVFWFARAYVIDPKLTYRIFSWKVLIYLVADILTNRKKLINAYKIFLFPNDWSSNEFIIHSLKTDMLACNKHLLYHLHWSETKGMYVGYKKKHWIEISQVRKRCQEKKTEEWWDRQYIYLYISRIKSLCKKSAEIVENKVGFFLSKKAKWVFLDSNI